MNEEAVRERFLRAEEEATQIIEALNALREEMRAHRGARESIEDAVEATRSVANGLSPVAVRIKELLISLEELGMAAFRADLTRIGEMVQDLDEGQDKLVSRIAHQLTETKFQETADTLATANALSDLAKSIATLRSEVDKANQALTAHAEQQRKRYLWLLVGLVLLAILTSVLAFLP